MPMWQCALWWGATCITAIKGRCELHVSTLHAQELAGKACSTAHTATAQVVKW